MRAVRTLDPRDEEIRVLELALKRAKKERRVMRLKAALARPEVKAKRSASLKAALARPEVKAKLSASLKAAWARPEVKAKRSASLKAALARPEVKAKLKAAWARPEVKAKAAATREIGQLIKDAREGAPKRTRARAVELDHPEDALEVALFGPRKRAVA